VDPVTAAAAETRIEDLLRELAPQVLGAVMRRFRDFDTAEDAVQEALVAAAGSWAREGLPDNPRGWLIQVAFRRLTDHLRSEQARRRREEQVAAEAQRQHELAPPGDDGDGDGDGDDTLILLFMCCHPALTPPSAIALTLRAVGGLNTAEIANAFLVPETTMAQRISRAKQTVKASGVPFQMPSTEEWGDRLRAVLHVLYLIFNEGYTSSGGPDLQRNDLANEAIRLTRAVHRLRPDDGEVTGLLALMLLTDARRLARTTADGDLVPLAEQDRGRWDQAAIAEGVALISGALARGAIGPYQLQAAVAALHDEAASTEATDWPQILALYGLLERMSPNNPMVMLNRAIAVAMVQGPAAGLQLLGALDSDGRLAGHHRLDAVRAHLLEMAGDHQQAIAHYRTAASRTTSLPEQRYLIARAARLQVVGV
jgi:RNA polymerase sigma factor (sigma-70 family)